ncbi:hypothetical protein ColKHC_09960 [Colletotrichum higginsianum]|uniref:Uncharacterized protein n=1 Tax=Colletotrichum higginsianum TaxID=80884 RepID=A0A4T0WJA3_9PEZI|nr:hypothetical protein CH35J_000825 [Colletotrichum higginsianum]GJD01135.1 hypothetical protein ColKHC_09960 [Colletotrichum higginsianum]
MADQETHGRWHDIVEKLFHRGLVSEFLNDPGNVISQVLSSPATTIQENAPAGNTQAPATTQAAAAPAPASTQAAAAPPATTQAPAAQQPAATPASSPKQEQQPQQPQQTSTPAVQASGAAQQPESTAGAAAAGTTGSYTSPVLTTSAPAAAETVPSAAENAASSQLLSQSGYSKGSGTVGGGGRASTTNSGTTGSTQAPQAPESGGTSTSTNQGPLVATGVVLGIVVLMGLSLLVYWCLRRKKRAALHRHQAVPPESPSHDYTDYRFRDHIDQACPPTMMTENRALNAEGDEFVIQHPQPGGRQPPPFAQTHPHPHPHGDPGGDAPHVNPYAAQPFSYAQAQQYVQSLADTGTFGYPHPPPIPQPSPIRIFRWPTRSSRSGVSTPSVFSGFRSHKSSSRNPSRTSRSTVTSMLWHGRRDVNARRTMTTNHSPVSPRPNFLHPAGGGGGGGLNQSPDSTMMGDGLHTPVLDWLNWIRGHQQAEPDPEMNHRKSFASTTETLSSDGGGGGGGGDGGGGRGGGYEGVETASKASTASSGVFSPTLHSWHPQASGAPNVTPETFQYLPLPLFRRPSSSDGHRSETSGGVRIPRFQ